MDRIMLKKLLSLFSATTVDEVLSDFNKVLGRLEEVIDTHDNRIMDAIIVIDKCTAIKQASEKEKAKAIAVFRKLSDLIN